MKIVDALDLVKSTGPFEEYFDKLMLYGQFVGSWDVESTWYDQEGITRKDKGEWHFQWILGGYGIQDVLFVVGAPPYKFGTTIRCYDKNIDAWHITWMQPFEGEFVTLLGHKVGNKIIQEGAGTDPHRLERWIFDNIRPVSFSWIGEVSFDNGQNWKVEQEMRVNRRRNRIRNKDNNM